MASIADVFVTVLPETGKIADGIKRALLAVDKDVKDAARRWKKEIEAELKGVEVKVDIKVDPQKAKKEIEKAAEDKTATITADAETGAAETQLDATARPRKAKIIADLDEASVATAGAKLTSGLQKATGTGKGFFGEGGVNLPFRATIPIPVAIEAIGITPNVVPLLGSMVRSVGQLSGAFALLPAVIGATGLAFGSLKIGMSGFADAIKEIGDPEKFAEAIKQLSPAAQQAATAIQGLMPQITQLKMTVQDALFTGMGEQFTKLGDTYLPIFRDVMSTMAASAGRAFAGVSNMLQTPEMQADIKTFGANASSAFALLLTAAQPLVKAFIDIATVGSTFLPQLATTVGELATKFADFIGEARESGKLAEWIESGIGALTDLKNIAVNVWDIFKGVFDAAGGGDFLDTVVRLTNTWSDWVNSVGGQNALRDFFEDAKQSLDEIWPILKDLGNILYQAFVGAKAVIDEILPLLKQITGALREQPGLVQAVGAAFILWNLSSIVNDIAKIGAALLGLQATAATAGTGIRAGLLAGLGGGVLGTLTINLAVAGGALAIWAGNKLLSEGKSITLPVGDVGVEQPIVNDDRSQTQTPRGQPNRTSLPVPTPFTPAIAPLPIPNTGPVMIDRNAPAANSPNLIPASQLPPPAPAPVQNYAPLPPAPGGGGGGAGGAGAPELVAPPGMSFSYGGYGELNWEALAQAESGGNWSMNTGNGYYGGLQFLPSTWEAYGGPPGTTADQFSKSDQIKVATALYNKEGIGPWPDNGWLLTATPEQLNQAGLTGSGRQSTSAGTRGRGGGGGGRGGGGGLSGTAGALESYAASMKGAPYGYGGEGPGSVLKSGAPASQQAGLFDCSGFMSDLYAIITGKPYSGDERYFTTESNFESLGFTRGYKEGAFNIGVNTSAAGAYGPGAHIAGELPSGMGVESTGGGVRYGPEAKDVMSFGEQYHIDVAGGNYGGGMGAYTYDGPGGTPDNPMWTESKSSGGEQLGQDIITGMLDVFGFGDIFKSPLDFGAFKLFKGMMEIPGKMFGGMGGGQGGATGDANLAGFPNIGGGGGDGGGPLGFLSSLISQPFGRLNTGSPANAPGEFIPGVSAPGGGGGLPDFLTSLVPGAREEDKSRLGGFASDNSFNVQINANQAHAGEVGQIVEREQAPYARRLDNTVR